MIYFITLLEDTISKITGSGFRRIIDCLLVIGEMVVHLAA